MDEIWEKALETALAGETEPETTRVLTLDGAVKCVHGHLPRPELLEKFQNLEHLSIASIGVSSLDQFPRLKKLQKLVLSDNRISGGLEFLVEAGLDSLCDLDLSNNRIHSIDDLVPLAQLKLVSLDLYECPVTRIKDYRSKVFELVKSLKYLDKMDAEENERPESDEEDDDDEEDEDEEDPRSCDIDDGEEKPNVNNVADVDEEVEDEEEEIETVVVNEDHVNGVRDEEEHHEENSDSDEYEDDGFLVDSDVEEDGSRHMNGELDGAGGHERVLEAVNPLLNVEDEESDESEEEDGFEDDGRIVVGAEDMMDEEEYDEDEGEVGNVEENLRVASRRDELMRNILSGEIDGHEHGEDNFEEDEQGVEDGEEDEEDEFGVEEVAQPVVEAIEVDDDIECEEECTDDEVQAGSSGLKRKRDDDDDGDGDGDESVSISSDDDDGVDSVSNSSDGSGNDDDGSCDDDDDDE